MTLENICKKFNQSVVLDKFNISFDKGVNCLFGPSGCGKTTLINIIADIIKADKGIVKNNFKNISVVFQDDRLLPWLTVKENISIVSDNETAEHYLNIMGLYTYKDNMPEHLSGGMRQRVNIARGLSFSYECLLMDEPFKGLELELKMNIIKFIKKELDSRQCIFITHDIDEAVYFSDRIFILNGPPLKIEKIILIQEDFKDRFKKEFFRKAEEYKNKIIG